MGDTASVDANAKHVTVAARIVLAVLLVALAALVAVPARWLGALAQTPAPTPTGPQIRWLNPDPQAPPEGTHDELSTKQDADNAYHLSAWVAMVPPNPHVEFEIQRGATVTAIGPAQRVADTDTWERFWEIPDGLADANDYVLRAKLFRDFTGPGTGTEVSRHEVTVEINNTGEEDPPPVPPNTRDPAARAETVEIVYPTNGGGLGIFTNPQGQSNFVMDAVASEGTQTVRFFYSRSAPGTNPTWTECPSTAQGREAAPPDAPTMPEGSRFFRARCNVTSDHDPASITAVAAVANDRPPDMTVPDPDADFDDSGDGHRVFPYSQAPTEVTVTPATQQAGETGAAGPFGCSNNITARVLDQEGRLVAGMKVDVHAKGPTDNLRFATDTGGTTGRSANRAPERGEHTTESGWNCGSGSAGGTQAEHDVPGALPAGADVKHVQNTATGTDKHGRFIFALRSDGPGGTQFTAWADRAYNDRFCENEPSGNGSIGWGQSAPAPTGVEPDEGPCPVATPTPTGAPPPTTPAATPTQTATATPTATLTGTPTATTPPSSPSPGPVVESGPCRGHPENSRTPRDDADGMVIVGDDGDNILEGTDGDDIICGLSGHDKIVGKAGNDELYGDNGQDDVRGHAGQDTVVGGNGHDTLYGNKGHDTLRGDRHNDVLRGGHHNDDLDGGRGHDTLRGGRRHDTLRGGNGNDELFGNRGNDTLNGGPGFDRCRGGPGRDETVNCQS